METTSIIYTVCDLDPSCDIMCVIILFIVIYKLHKYIPMNMVNLCHMIAIY